MIVVTVISDNGEKHSIVANNFTIRRVFEWFKVDYSNTVNTINGVRITDNDMNKTLKDFGIDTECHIVSSIKTNDDVQSNSNNEKDYCQVVFQDSKTGSYHTTYRVKPEILSTEIRHQKHNIQKKKIDDTVNNKIREAHKKLCERAQKEAEEPRWGIASFIEGSALAVLVFWMMCMLRSWGIPI